MIFRAMIFRAMISRTMISSPGRNFYAWCRVSRDERVPE
jgi:hypothetical protein